MREIKFRVWDSKHNRMLHLGTVVDMCYKADEGTINIKDWDDMISIDRIELMQYTGLKDKNGEEIYEGDIVKTPYGKGQIFERLCCWFVNLQKELGYFTIDEPIEILGNIHENPELLEGK